MIVTMIILLLLFLIAIEVPVAFAMMIAGTIGLWLVSNFTTVSSFLGGVIYEHVSSYILVTVPMFVLMSQLLSKSGMARDVIQSGHLWLGRFRGGLGYASVFSGSILAAVIGTSTAACATISSAVFPTMKKLGYDERFSIGVIAISGTLAIMIPPSLILILYGILTEVSIGKLLIAGLIPGVLTAVGYILTIMIWVRKNPTIAPKLEKFDFKAALLSLQAVWPIILLVAVVLGSIYLGVATPTEIGALGSFIALLLFLILRRSYLKELPSSFTETAKTTIMLLSIIVGATVFGYFLTYTQSTQYIIESIRQTGLSVNGILILLLIMYLILGMFMDQVAILFLTVPLTFALISDFNVNPIWFGILLTKTVEIGMVTPPVGLNIFVASNVTKVPAIKAFQGVAPFILVELVILLLLFCFPDLSLYLPNQMNK